MMQTEPFSPLFLKGRKKMEEKDEELQTNFGATRWYIWAGGDRGRPKAQLYQQFLLIVQLVAGKH